MRKLTLPKSIESAVWDAAKTPYHDAVLSGSDNWSGSSLTGKAKRYGGTYKRSRDKLIELIDDFLPRGWAAYTDLVRKDGESVWRRELLIRRSRSYALLHGPLYSPWSFERNYKASDPKIYLWSTGSTKGFRLK